LNDSPEIVSMLQRLARYEGAATPPLLTESSLKQYVFGDAPVAHVLVAENTMALVGFILFFETFSSWAGGPTLHIGDLWVEEHARSRGIGRQLLQQAAHAFPDRRTDVYVVRSNTARTFYESCGFNEQQEWALFRKTSAT
jgi:ribosomal protein S18 acetylase RimI-like enzyme